MEEISYLMEIPNWVGPAINYGLCASSVVLVGALGILVYWTVKHGKDNLNQTERQKEGDLPKVIDNGR